MKKTIFAAIVIVTMFAVSCKSNETSNATTPSTDTTTVSVDTTVTTHTVTVADTTTHSK